MSQSFKKHGWFRVVSWNKKTRDLELDCNGLDDPNAEIAFCEWLLGGDWSGILTFRGETFKIGGLGLLIARSNGSFATQTKPQMIPITQPINKLPTV